MKGLTNAYIISSSREDRKKNDYYPTPAIATLTLLRNHDVPKRIWEPAAGRGHISKELLRNEYEVVSTDLVGYEDSFVPIETGVDFTTCDRVDADGIITNPPFLKNLPEKLILRVLEEWDYPFLALFVRLTFMESKRRYDLFKKHPPTKVMVLSGRVNCNENYFDKKHGLGGMVAYAWFIWDKRVDYTNRIEWVRPEEYVGELD